MRYTGIQPQYFPRLHYFARILNADIFMFRDDAQFVAKHKYPDGKTGFSYQADTPIKQAFGEFFLHVPVKHDGLKPIGQTTIAYDTNWTENHLKTLQYSYSKSPRYSEISPQIAQILDKKEQTLFELNFLTTMWGLLHILGEEKVTVDKLTDSYIAEKLKTQKQFRLKKIMYGSQTEAYKDKTTGDKNQRIINACKEIGATEDYCGSTALEAYMDRELFEKNGIKLIIQNWKCREYPQMFMKKQPFIPNLSIIDLLMNVPDKEAAEILKESE